MIKRIGIYVLVASIVLACWKVAGGDGGVMFSNAATFLKGFFDFTSAILIDAWPEIKAVFN